MVKTKIILFLAAAFVALPALAHAEEVGYKIGWIASFSGVGSAWSESGTRGIQLALDVINAQNLAGKNLSIITVDDAGDPKTSADVCKRLVLQDKVDAIVGFEPTPARLACNQAALKAGIPYIASTGTAGDVCFPNMITDGVISNQMVGPLVAFFSKQGAHRFYLLGSDYSTPRATMKMAQGVIAEQNGEIVGQSFAPMGTADFTAEFDKIAAAKPDVVLVNVVGTDDLTFHKQFASDPRVSFIKRGDLLLFESVAHTLGSASKGIIAVGNYFATIKSPANETFRKAFTQRFGDKIGPDANTVNAYNGMMLLAGALKQGNGDDKASIAALGTATVNGPNGTVTIIHQYAAQPSYIGRAVGDGSIEALEGSAPIAPIVNCKT